MSEIELRDAILRHSLQLQRLAAGQSAKAEKILRELAKELRLLIRSADLSGAAKVRIQELIDDADAAIRPAYVELASSVDTQGLALIVASRTVKAIEEVIPLRVFGPTAETLASLTNDVLIYGAPSSAWWSKQGEDTAFKFAAAVRQGVVNGETNEKIVARVVGDGGFMDLARSNARALVHSSVMSAANDARLATFQKNAALLDGVRWLSTLDSHTCLVCAALDGAAWDLEGKPIGATKLAFQSPPKHWNCRCVLSPIPKSFASLGLDIPEPETGTRASSEGPISATTTFSDFLKRQPVGFVERTLGKRRAELFLEGKITLRDLISGTGRELTLEELDRHL